MSTCNSISKKRSFHHLVAAWDWNVNQIARHTNDIGFGRIRFLEHFIAYWMDSKKQSIVLTIASAGSANGMTVGMW